MRHRYPAAPAPSYNQAAVDAILNEQNAHAVDFDEVDRRNLRHAERAGYGGGGLRESVHRGQREGIRAPERARPPRDESDDDSFYGDDRRGGRGGAPRERYWRILSDSPLGMLKKIEEMEIRLKSITQTLNLILKKLDN